MIPLWELFDEKENGPSLHWARTSASRQTFSSCLKEVVIQISTMIISVRGDSCNRGRHVGGRKYRQNRLSKVCFPKSQRRELLCYCRATAH